MEVLTMAVPMIRNAGGVPFLTLRGSFVVRNAQQPDGDTIAFAASAAYAKGRVKTNVPVSTDGKRTVNIRLQSIDAPEKAQPLGAKSRDGLLRKLGFVPGELGLSETDFTASGIAGGGVAMRPGWLATHGLDANQRPLGYVFPGNVSRFEHGQEIPAEAVRAVLRSSANHAQVSGGAAFPAFYDNTEESHALVFQAAAQQARKRARGVWAADATTRGFKPAKLDLEAPAGALVYPKFYRRVAEWKSSSGSAAAFIEWLKKQSDGKKLVSGAECHPVPLWQLFVRVSAQRVAVPYDVTKLWFSQ
jgi:endonuclease YncB( thermonuclease family)